MCRCIYFLGLLLLCVNLSFCYDYLSNDEVNAKLVNRKNRVDGRKSRRKFNNKHQAQIDVARFIQTPDIISSVDENQPYDQYEQKFGDPGIDYGTYGSFVNSNDEIKKDAREYKHFKSDIIPEVNLINAKHFVPQRMNLNRLPLVRSNSETAESHKIGDIKQFILSPHNPKVERLSRTEKKCVAKNMKFPFFSHKNAEKPKPKKEKRRKLFGFRKVKKLSTSASKSANQNAKKVAGTTEFSQNINKINKRSYLETLCPACKQKFFKNSNLDALNNGRQISNNQIIHNSRQYFQKKTENPKNLDIDKQYSFEVKPNILDSNIGYESKSIKRQRCKRNELSEEQRTKVLQDLENKIHILKMNYQQM